MKEAIDSTTLNQSLQDQSVFFRCVDECSEPMMISDGAGRLLYVNQAWVQTYGYSKEEAVGATPRLLRSSLQTDEFYQQMWRKILNPAIGHWKGEIVNRAKDGRLVPVLLTITPYTHEGQILGYMGVAVDLTERRSMEQQILRQDRLASIGMLASSLAHEIGNPLGVIRGRAEIVLESMRSGNPASGATGKTAADATSIFHNATQSLDIIVGQIDRIARLIDSLLKISRVPQELTLREVKIRGPISEVVTLLSETCRRKGIELVDEVEDLIVFSDAQHLQQILLNLAINAVHAMEEETKRSGRVNHRLTLSSSTRNNDEITIHVADTGCGLSPEVKRRMFEPFYTTKTPGQGTGLGLAIVSRLSEEMRATINAESDGPGLGSVFHLVFSAQNAQIKSMERDSTGAASRP